MPKSYRIRTKINEDSFVRVNLEQDFDLLEILSLKLTQSEVYSRMCADYGVVVGRVMANGGLGLPNAKLSVFIPLTDEDEQDAIISEMYPFRDVNDKNDEGYRYNLLPKTQQHNRHTPTGSMYSAEETISNPIKLEVYEKYYKYTVKTNENGDYMIWGVPLGSHQIHMSVDVSDIGCHSMKPFDFIAQGVPIENFKNAAIFNDSENLDTLPQIVIQNKTLEVVPFWGDDDLCNTGISRVDFDLRDSNVEFKPNALLMGSIMSDDNNNSVGWKCKPSKHMGEVCKMTTGSGKIEAIRFTVYKKADGCTPKLEKFNLHSIDGSGSFVARVPMNLDYIYTDEYGNEQISDNTSIGVPTRGKYRFRISFDQKYSSETRKGEYLVPNIREYIGADLPRSYSFSEDLYEYPETISGDPSTIVTSPAFLGHDYFYEFTSDRVYTIAQHIDMYRNDYTPNDFSGGAVNPASSTRPYFKQIGSSVGRNRWEFIGIKSTNPPYESDCSGSIKEFPANDGFRGGSFIFLMTQLNLFVTQLSVFAPFLLLSLIVIISSFQFLQNLGQTLMSAAAASAASLGIGFGFGAVQTVQAGSWVSTAAIIAQALLDVAFQILLANLLVNAMDSLRYNLGLTKFEECENCNCGEFFKLEFESFWGAAEIEEKAGNIVVDDPACQIAPLKEGTPLYFSPAHNEEMGDNSSKGCYSVSFEGSGFKGAFNTAIWAIASTGIAAVFVPYGVGSWLVTAITKVGIPAFVIWFAVIILERLALIFLALNEWRVRKNIYNGLCQGVFNMGFWNSWIRGTLYHFRFSNFKNIHDGPPLKVDDFYCKDVVVGPLEVNDQHYYYRSCPYSPTTQEFNISGRQATPFDFTAAGNLPATVQYQYRLGISYPTTIIELGTFEDMTANNSCVDCGADVSNDFFIDRMEASSQKSSNGILDYAINQKMMRYKVSDILFTGINHWFGGRAPYNLWLWPPMAQGQTENVRNAGISQPRLLDGDIAQLVASNNEIGTYKFPSLFYYPQDTNYGPLPGGVIDSRINKKILKIPSKISDDKLRDYLVGDTNGYPKTQIIPYYGWQKPLASFGDYDNDWDRVTILSTQAQPGKSIVPPFAPINPVSPYNSISTGFYHYYFGLYQGNNAYDQFVNKYMPPID